MTSAVNLIYNPNSYTDDLNQDFAIIGKSLVLSDGISVVGNINTEGVYQQDNLTVLNVKGNSSTPTNCNVSVGLSNISDSATGYGNVAIGFQAAMDLTSGTNNISLGYLAGTNLTTGQSNISLGSASLQDNKTGNNNISIGTSSQLLLNGQVNNITIGSNSLSNALTANNNIFMGTNSATGASENKSTYCIGIGGSTLSINEGTNNIAVGFGSMLDCTSGNNNLCLGVNAGNSISSGSYNIILGNIADSDLSPNSTTTGNSNIIIGFSAVPAGNSDSNSILLTTTPAITGQGSNSFVVDPNCINSAPAANGLLGYNSVNGRISLSTTITPQMTFSNGALLHASKSYSLTNMTTVQVADSGNSYTITNNDSEGVFNVVIGTLASGVDFAATVILNCSAFTSTSQFVDGRVISTTSNAANSAVICKSAFVNSAGVVHFLFSNPLSASTTSASTTAYVHYKLIG